MAKAEGEVAFHTQLVPVVTATLTKPPAGGKVVEVVPKVNVQPSAEVEGRMVVMPVDDSKLAVGSAL